MRGEGVAKFKEGRLEGESSVVMIKCKCKHDFQDRKYGKGNRVANKRSSDKNKGEAKCTVCGNIRTI